jgi:hypothetical protein
VARQDLVRAELSSLKPAERRRALLGAKRAPRQHKTQARHVRRAR